MGYDRDETFIQSLIGTFIQKTPTEVKRENSIATFKVGSIAIRKTPSYVPARDHLAALSRTKLAEIRMTSVGYFVTCDGELDRLTFCFGGERSPPVGTYFVEPTEE